MRSNIYIPKKPCIISMANKIKSLEELTIPNVNEKVRVSVDYKQNGSNTDYLCEVENDGSLKITTAIPPKGYSIESIFVDGYDIPAVGMRIQERILDARGISVEGYKGSLIYGKTLEEIPRTAEELRAAISKFAADVFYASREVDRMALRYIRNVSRDVPPHLKKYLNVG